MKPMHSNRTSIANRTFPRRLKARASAIFMLAISCVALAGFSTPSMAQGPDARVIKPSASAQQLSARAGGVVQQKKAGGSAGQNGITVPVCFLDIHNKPKCIVVVL